MAWLGSLSRNVAWLGCDKSRVYKLSGHDKSQSGQDRAMANNQIITDNELEDLLDTLTPDTRDRVLGRESPIRDGQDLLDDVPLDLSPGAAPSVSQLETPNIFQELEPEKEKTPRPTPSMSPFSPVIPDLVTIRSRDASPAPSESVLTIDEDEEMEEEKEEDPADTFKEDLPDSKFVEEAIQCLQQGISDQPRKAGKLWGCAIYMRDRTHAMQVMARLKNPVGCPNLKTKPCFMRGQLERAEDNQGKQKNKDHAQLLVAYDCKDSVKWSTVLGYLHAITGVEKKNISGKTIPCAPTDFYHMARYCHKDFTCVDSKTRFEWGRAPRSCTKMRTLNKKDMVEKVVELVEAHGPTIAKRKMIQARIMDPDVFEKAMDQRRFVIELEQEDAAMENAKKMKLMPWQEMMNDMLNAQADDRSIVYVLGKQGNEGKSKFIDYYCAMHPEDAVFVGNGKSSDMSEMLYHQLKYKEKVRVVLMNQTRTEVDFMNYSFFEHLKDGKVYKVKYNSQGINIGCTPHVIIFTNQLPDFSEKMHFSEDRYKFLVLGRNKTTGEVDWKWYDDLASFKKIPAHHEYFSKRKATEKQQE